VLSAPSPSRRYARLRDKMVDDACMNVASRTLVQAGAPLVEISDPFKLEVVADLLSTDARRSRKVPRCGSMGGAEQPSK
jgi:hypothetical protein